MLQRQVSKIEVNVTGVAAVPAAAATRGQNQVERGLLPDVVVGQDAAVLQLLPGKDKALLVRRDTYKIAIKEKKIKATITVSE